MSTAPRFGVGAIILHDDRSRILVGQRFGSHGDGSWQLAGGHLEQGEGILHCAVREAKEETGLDVEARRVVATTYAAFGRERKHYVTWFVLCQMKDPGAVPEVSLQALTSGLAQEEIDCRPQADESHPPSALVQITTKAREPDKCPAWHWRTVEELRPLNLFLPLAKLLQQSSDLQEVVRGRGPVFKLPRVGAGRPVVSIEWDPACVADVRLAGDTITLPWGSDITIVDASPENTSCGLDIVVADADRQDEWPLGNDILLSGGGLKATSSLLDLYHAKP
ncbi:hypothetical protein CDD83_846 [Cordyceps sp. RAO-2017]|nr:hypothetical protein CDD83_846 [Cordyceps sp. RAO-2017]